MTPHQAVADPVFLARLKRVADRIHACQPVPGRDADDVAQSIVAVVLRRAGRFDPARATAEAFVKTAARSAALSLMRDAGRKKRDPRKVRPLTEADVSRLLVPEDDASDRDHAQRRTAAAIGGLTPEDAEVARDLQRFGVNNARKRLGLNRAQWAQTKERLRLALEAENTSENRANSRRRFGDGVSM